LSLIAKQNCSTYHALYWADCLYVVLVFWWVYTTVFHKLQISSLGPIRNKVTTKFNAFDTTECDKTKTNQWTNTHMNMQGYQRQKENKKALYT